VKRAGSGAMPTVLDLLEAIEECLADEVLPDAEGRTRHLVRLSAAAVAQVRRDLELGPDLEAAHRRRLDRLGVADDIELADEIRRGGLTDDRRNDVLAALRERVADQLSIVSSGSGRQ
jgi:hypothetical protein